MLTICLIIFVSLLVLIICYIKDKKDKRRLNIISSKSDILQKYIIKYTKDRLHLNYSILKLFWCVFKVNILLYFILIIKKYSHPVISIFKLYDYTYCRSLRMMDLYIEINITIFFNLLPYYYLNNENHITAINTRNIVFQGNLLDTIALSLKIVNLINKKFNFKDFEHYYLFNCLQLC